MADDNLLEQLRIDRRADAHEPAWQRPAMLVVLVLVVAALSVGGWRWWQASRLVTVELVQAAAPSAEGPATDAVLQATGYVTARRQATVSAQITGTLVEVLIEEGETVEAGQVLARLEDTAARASFAQAQAQHAQALAMVEQLLAQSEQSRRHLQRQETLFKRALIGAETVENARMQADVLDAQLKAQRRAADVARAQVDSAQVQLDYTTVRAPFAGVVIAKTAQVGEIVSPLSAGGGFTRTGVGTIVDMDSLEIEVDVNEAFINRVVAGAPAEAVLDAYPDWTIAARVVAIIPTADRSKATVKVRVALLERDARILPDMGVRVSFLPVGAPADEAAQQQDSDAVLLPASAVVKRDGGDVVFVVIAGRAQARPVQVADRRAGRIQLESVAAGTMVVRAPPEKLQSGARVAVRDRGN